MQVSLSTRVEVETYKLLTEYAEKSGMSKAQIVDQALNYFLLKRA